MDVVCHDFWQTLPSVLEAISLSDFVTVDIEMTGVKVARPVRKQTPSVHEAYVDAKEAAETFQIIQLGLCCLRYDPARGYIATPYSFSLTPLFTADTRAAKYMANLIDRRLCISYSSLLFLQSYGFRLENAIPYGIPYLARGESDAALRQLSEKDARDVHNSPVVVEQQANETRQFYDETRAALQAWSEGNTDGDYHVVENPHGGRLNHLQIKLIHQLLATDFPQYRAFVQYGGQYLHIRKKMADADKAAYSLTLERIAAVRKQTGLRYVLEALVGGDFAEYINPEWVVQPDQADREIKMLNLKRNLELYEQRLKEKRPILVAHNQFYDLTFIQHTFFGPLSEDIKEFGRQTQALFPRIIDTKYMATRNTHAMSADESLPELYARCEDQLLPRITLEGGAHMKTRAHDAAFDSYMTAVVLVRLAWNLSQAERNQQHIPEDDGSHGDLLVADEGTEALVSGNVDGTAPMDSPASRFAPESDYEPLRGSGRSISPNRTLLDDGEEQLWASQITMQPLQPTILAPRLASSMSQASPSPPASRASRASQVSGYTQRSQMSQASQGALDSNSSTAEEDNVRIPEWGSEFWAEFGNKLRIGAAGVLDFSSLE